MPQNTKPQGGIGASLIGAFVGWGVGHLASKGIHIDVDAQMAITVAIYGLVHRVLGRWGF